MKHRLLALWALGLAGCTAFVADYEERLIRSLPNQREVTLSQQETFPGQILCGRFTTLTGSGFRFHTGDFVVGDDFVLANPSDVDLAVYCSPEPAQALREQTGISAPDDDWSTLAKVRDDMQAIDRAVLQYYNRRQTLPKTLDLLLEDNYGITPESLSDPWGQPYRYRGGLSGRTVPQYTLVSLGEDGVPGGKRLGADISREQLRLLDHVLRVSGY